MVSALLNCVRSVSRHPIRTALAAPFLQPSLHSWHIDCPWMRPLLAPSSMLRERSATPLAWGTGMDLLVISGNGSRYKQEVETVLSAMRQPRNLRGPQLMMVDYGMGIQAGIRRAYDVERNGKHEKSIWSKSILRFW